MDLPYLKEFKEKEFAERATRGLCIHSRDGSRQYQLSSNFLQLYINRMNIV